MHKRLLESAQADLTGIQQSYTQASEQFARVEVAHQHAREQAQKNGVNTKI